MADRFNLADYEEVKDRIPKFYERYPEGRITTRITWMADDASRVIIEASLFANRDDQECGCPLATGIAEETQGVGMVNKTAHVENCETSAIGRAIYNSPLAESGKPRPSREEMQKVARGTHSHVAGSYPEQLDKARKAFFAHARDLNIDSELAKQIAKDTTGAEHFNDLNLDELRTAYKALQEGGTR